MPTPAFHPINDFTHMGLLVEASNVLLVKADTPYRTPTNTSPRRA
jgi:hypothetical protein